MSLLEIILLLVAIAAGGLYYFAKITVKAQKQELKDSDLRYQEMIHLSKNYAEKDRLKTLEIENLNQVMKEHGNDFRELNSQYENAKEEIRELLERINKGQKSNIDLKPVRLEELQYDLEYKGEISWSSLEINIALLINDSELFDAFENLFNSKLIPESIYESIDFQLADSTVVIWCMEFDEEGTSTRSLTWYEIIQQIITKKQIITEYLKREVQAYNRALLVHKALSEKGKEVTNA